MSKQGMPPVPASGDDEYYVYPSIESDMIHTADHPFCDDMSCDCHSDDNQEAIDELGQQYQDGLVSTGDADRIFRGRTL